MGRNIPLGDDISISLHQTVSFSLVFAGVAAVIAVSTSLCGIRFGRRSSSESKTPYTKTKTKSSESESSYKPEILHITSPLTSTSQSVSSVQPLTIKIENAVPTPSHQKQQKQPLLLESENAREKENIRDLERKELLLPPLKQLKETFSCKNLVTKSASSRNLVKNISMRSMSMMRRDHHREEKSCQKKGIKLKHEDSVWTKTIILGEKCRVPDEDQEPAIYDSKGNRIATYHPKTPKSLPVSRQNSCVDIPTSISLHVQDIDK